MLLGNSRYLTVGTSIGGANVLSNKFKIKEEEWFGVTRISEYAGYPQGYGGKSFAMPLSAGNLSSREDIAFTSQASGAMGVNAEANADISVIFANADAQLIVSGFGSTSLSMTVEGSVIASLSGIASTTFSFSLNHLAMFVDAYGFASASLDLVTSGNGTLRAIAICGGTTVDTSGLTPASVWAYQDRTLTSSSGSGGLTTEQSTQLANIEALASLIPATL